MPVARAKELRVRVHAATVTRGDVILRGLPLLMWLPMRLMLGLRRRKIPGTEFAGEVEAVGVDVRRFQKGDQVFGTTSGLRAGSYAEYVCVPADGTVAAKPANMTYESAAALSVGGCTALHFLREANIETGQRALIYGASGSVGTFAVQLARHFGAEATGVCSTPNLDLVGSLGAEHLIDYTREDFTEARQTYDLIFDAVGKMPRSDCRDALAPDGSYVSVAKGLARETYQELALLGELAAEGALRSVIDRRYRLAQIAEAHRYVEQGHKRGNVVIAIRHGDHG